jgi:lysine-N-methylase
MKPAKVLQPQYFDSFHCIGSECEDTCCRGWIIHIDKNTYDKYQDCSDPEYGPSLRTLIKINEKHSGGEDYANIILNGGVCPFLSERLCSIQGRLGEEYLSNMCATYPRVMNYAGDVLRRSLDLSCPEAARIVLLDPRPMEFHQEEYQDASVRLGNFPSLDTSGSWGSIDPLRFFGSVQRLVFSILQDRSYPIWKRLLMVGRLCEKLDEVRTRGINESSVNAMEECVDQLKGGLLEDLQAHDSVAPTVQLQTVLELIVARISSDSNPRRFLECYWEFMSGIEWTAKSTMEDIAGRYAEAYRQHYCVFMSRHEHMLEQYLVNYAYRTLFPFGLPESNARLAGGRASSPVAAQYMLLVAYYAITQTLLIGSAGFHKSEFGVDRVIKLMQASTKTFEHSLTFPGRVIEMLAAKNLTSPSSLCVLIRN